MSDDKTFKVGERFSAVAFRNSYGGFINFKVGDWQSIAADMHLEPDEAEALSRALAGAVAFARGKPEPQPMECIGKECVSPEVCADPNVRCALV